MRFQIVLMVNNGTVSRRNHRKERKNKMKILFGSATITDWESFLNRWWFDTHRPQLPGRGPTSIIDGTNIPDYWAELSERHHTDTYIPQPPVTPIVP